jgi:hypothetical protein
MRSSRSVVRPGFTPDSLGKYIRDDALTQAKVIYEQTA